MSEGSHTFAVKALADTESGYTDSEYSSVTVFVAGKADTHSMRFLIGNYTHNYARISFMPGTAESYKVALIPASDTTPDADIIDMLNNLPSDQVYNISSLTEERTFEGWRQKPLMWWLQYPPTCRIWCTAAVLPPRQLLSPVRK